MRTLKKLQKESAKKKHEPFWKGLLCFIRPQYIRKSPQRPTRLCLCQFVSIKFHRIDVRRCRFGYPKAGNAFLGAAGAIGRDSRRCTTGLHLHVADMLTSAGFEYRRR